MPDDDRFSRYLAPAWRKVLRSLQGRAPVERVADDVSVALAATVRGFHGFPTFTGIVERMQEAAVQSAPFKRIGRPDGRHVPTDLAEQAATALAVTMQRELALVSPAQATNLLAQRVVADLAYHYGFDRMLAKLLNETYSISSLRALFTEILSGEQVVKFVTRFVAHPTGDGLRAPARRLKRLSATEVLNVDLEDLWR